MKTKETTMNSAVMITCRLALIMPLITGIGSNLARAEFAFSDSSEFALELPGDLYIGSTADSQPFSMNLSPVYRTSSDSSYFRVWNWYGDLNDSGRVDMEDLEILSRHWAQVCNPPEFCDESDTGPDGTIDMKDLLDLASVWLQSPPG